MGLALSTADIDRLTSEAQAAGIATVDELIAKLTVAEDHELAVVTALLAPFLAELQGLRADLAAVVKLVSGGVKLQWENGYVTPPNT
jgi:hypothetical protein